MNILRNSVFPAFLVLLFLLFLPSGAEASCTKVAGEILFAGGANPVQENGVASDQCSDIPDAYLVTFNKLGVCKANPLTGAAAFGAPDFSSCQFMYNGPIIHKLTTTKIWSAKRCRTSQRVSFTNS